MSSELNYPIGRFFTRESIQLFFATVNRQAVIDHTIVWRIALEAYLQNQDQYSASDKLAICRIDKRKYDKLFFELNPN